MDNASSKPSPGQVERPVGPQTAPSAMPLNTPSAEVERPRSSTRNYLVTMGLIVAGASYGGYRFAKYEESSGSPIAATYASRETWEDRPAGEMPRAESAKGRDKKREPRSSGEKKEKIETPSAETVACDTGPLKGNRLGDLFTRYTSISGKAPEKIDVNFYDQLSKLWDKKKDRSPRNRVVVEACDQVLEEYKSQPRQTMSLDDYTEIIKDTVDDTKEKLSWDKIAEVKGMSAEEKELAKKVVDLLDEKSVLAYSLTELMPSADGVLNKNVLEFLLKYAGARFVYSIPAIGDPMTSFGPYQFTSYALHDLPGDRRGASVVNAALPKEIRIPGSVIKLQEEDHHRAAFLFMVDNICDLVKRSEKSAGWEQLDDSKKVAHLKEQIVIFCATAHHQPAIAKRRAAEWIEAGGADKLIAYLTPHLKAYAVKTRANLHALD